MCIMINRNGLYSLITFIISATIVSSSPQTFHVQKYGGPNGNKAPPSIQLYQSLSPGMVLSIVVSSTGRSINYNVYDALGNRLLCMQPRIDQNQYAMNTLVGTWGTEEITTFSIKNDEKYCLHIAYDTNGYRIFLNGAELYFYKHRTQNKPNTFVVEGTGKVFLMSYKLNEPQWAIQQTKNAVNIEEFGDEGIDTPYEVQYLSSNQLFSVAITGIISVNADSVEINLMNSNGETLFQFNPRFTDNVVALNSFLDGRWGKEETRGAMVFQRNQKFTVAIDVEADYYKTYVNGEDFITYEHRKPAQNITRLYISAGIKLLKLIYHN